MAKTCAHPGCSTIVERGRCPAHRSQQRQYDSNRGGGSARGYDHRWQKIRRLHLNHEPLCRMCLEAGRTRAATVVDHITPHRGNRELFLDPGNLQSLCAHCHNSHKQRQEKLGIMGCDENGFPADPSHHWN